MNPVIFLDIDGVLNNYVISREDNSLWKVDPRHRGNIIAKSIHKEFLHFLKQFESHEIVIISSWYNGHSTSRQHGMSKENIKLFSEILECNVVDGIANTGGVGEFRFKQSIWWLQDHNKPLDTLIIYLDDIPVNDDIVQDQSHGYFNLIKPNIHGRYGLTTEIFNELDKQIRVKQEVCNA